MAYIGRGTDNISNVEVLDNITFDGSSTYTLQKGSVNFVPTSANNILVSIDGVVQANNFSVSTSTIDFGVAIAGTSTCNFILHFGTGLVTTVQDGAITSAKLGADSVTYAKLQNLATANRVLGSASTGLIGETQIATAMVSDDAITYGKMQDTVGANKVLGAVTAGTIGEVTIATDMLTDASVDEAKLKISNSPTNGYMLTAQSGDTGGLTWASAGGGANTLISTTTASSDATISITGMDSTYKIYTITLNTIIGATDAVTLYCAPIIGGAVKTDAYHPYAQMGRNSSAGAIGNESASSTYWKMSISDSGNATGEHLNGEIKIYDPSNTSEMKMITWTTGTNLANGSVTITTGAGQYSNGTAAMTGLNFRFASGAIATGVFKLWGTL